MLFNSNEVDEAMSSLKEQLLDDMTKAILTPKEDLADSNEVS
ncbi:hypothetical protein EV06_1107 [Prochlorococcus sp. MIT 0602]|nr:hypothetical protein EV06_1107 [Prochlorococcus sp. MIT 0602]KGG17513.1 hypothetical protein EV07_0953 [Prochlorococcus sp. MIT 0603]